MDINYNNVLKGKLILVVEDVESNFHLIRFLLKVTGVAIDRAISGEQALQQSADLSMYDLIIMDIRLPGMNGDEVIRKIREKDKNTPIVVNSASVMKADQEKAIKSGCDAFIPKPTDRNVLVGTVANLILNN